MARPRKDSVAEIKVLERSFAVYAKIGGKQIRERFFDRRDAEARRAELQQKLLNPEDRSQHLRMTRLTEEQLRDAEAAVLRANGRSLVECVEAAERVLVSIYPVPLTTARDEWIAESTRRRREPRTLENNAARVAVFLKWLPAEVQTVQAVTPEHAEAYIMRQSYSGEERTADLTRLTHARILRAWGRFWLRRRWVKISPFDAVDVGDMADSAEPAELPRILTPAQARGLMEQARTRAGGLLAPYVALSCWCFLRHAEVLRVSADDLRLDAAVPVVEVRPKKRGTAAYRTVTIPPCVVPILRAAVAAVPPAERAAWRVPWGRVRWDHLRAAAGLVELSAVRNRKRAVASTVWQENILRHTGLSYCYQLTGDMRETTRQAGNSSDVAFRHYLQLPAAGAAQAFYAPFT